MPTPPKHLSPRTSHKSVANDPRIPFANNLNSVLINGKDFSNITLSLKALEILEKKFSRHHALSTPNFVTSFRSHISYFPFSFWAKHPLVSLQVIHSASHHPHSLAPDCISSSWFLSISRLYMHVALLTQRCILYKQITKCLQVFRNVIQHIELQPICSTIACLLNVGPSNLLNFFPWHSSSNCSFSFHPLQPSSLEIHSTSSELSTCTFSGKLPPFMQYI